MIVLVTGGRDFEDRRALFEFLDALRPEIDAVVHGDHWSGADLFAKLWCRTRSVEERPYPAKWKEFGKRAGMIRNAEMLKKERVDLCVACPGGRGTNDMVERCEKAGIEVKRVVIESERHKGKTK